MPEHEQFDYLWAYGTYLATRSDDQHKINLYAVGEFFVEVWYNSIDNKLSHLTTFKAKRLLDQYLDGIDIALK